MQMRSEIAGVVTFLLVAGIGQFSASSSSKSAPANKTTPKVQLQRSAESGTPVTVTSELAGPDVPYTPDAPPRVHRARPLLPYEDAGCPFECCEYGDWTVKNDADAVLNREAGAAAVFSLRSGQKVETLAGVVVTEKFGRAVVRMVPDPNPYVSWLRKDEPLDIINYAGEGRWQFWARNQIGTEPMAASQECTLADGAFRCDIEIVSKPEVVWWVKVRNSAGQVGWVLSDNLIPKGSCG